jgi:hypothetical protein
MAAQGPAGRVAARGPEGPVEAADQADAASELGPRERDVGSLLRLVREQQEAYCALYERNTQLHREWSETQLEVVRLRAAAGVGPSGAPAAGVGSGALAAGVGPSGAPAAGGCASTET